MTSVTRPKRPIRTLLVANRGEIACRVFRTARAMGIDTAAVFSDADAGAVHTRAADAAVRLPGTAPSDTYLNVERLLTAAAATGADAVHPGYGFLAENADFARAVVDAGLIWVGPPADAIAAMGSKLAAKELMRASGVPTLPWSTDPDEAAEVGFPLLVKASAGGGGRGMRIVRSESELAEAVTAARREAGSAFGDDTVFLERYVDDPRHVEIQIFADQHGNVVSLFERECSIQRRHQKLVEEAPSPAVDDKLRARMGEAAVEAARAVGYEGAGTVEFVLDAAGEFAFLEMNTRLQVEHPVTEAITGLDLVRLQLLVAAGEPLPAEALDPELKGHAIEVRVVAEDVMADFLPQSGRLRTFELDGAVAFGAERRGRVSVDSGFGSGCVVPAHYDSLLAKVIAHAATREEAAGMLAGVLSRSRVFGLATDLGLLVGILREPEFLAGSTDTGYLSRHDPKALTAGQDVADVRRASAVVAALANQRLNRLADPVWGGLPSGWRNNPSQPQTVRLRPAGGAATAGDETVEVTYRSGRSGWAVTVDGVAVDVEVHAIDLDEQPDRRQDVAIDLTVAGIRRRGLVCLSGEPLRRFARTDRQLVDVWTAGGSATWEVEPRFVDPASAVALGSLVAPMPGTVVRVLTEVGQTVDKGTPLVVLEAMKMEHTVAAPSAGVVSAIEVSPGQQVDSGSVMVVVDEGDPT